MPTLTNRIDGTCAYADGAVLMPGEQPRVAHLETGAVERPGLTDGRQPIHPAAAAEKKSVQRLARVVPQHAARVLVVDAVASVMPQLSSLASHVFLREFTRVTRHASLVCPL